MSGDRTPPDGTQRLITSAQLLTMRTEHSTDAVVIRVAGEIDLCTASTLRTCLTAQLVNSDKRPILVLDLAAVNFMSCTGLRVLLDVQHCAATHGAELRLAGCPRLVLRLLEVADLRTRFQTYPTVRDALLDRGAKLRQ